MKKGLQIGAGSEITKRGKRVTNQGREYESVQNSYNHWCENGTKNIQIKKVYNIEIIKVTIFPTGKKCFNISVIIIHDNNNNIKSPPE